MAWWDTLYGPGGVLDMTGKPRGLPWVAPGMPAVPPPATPSAAPTALPRPQPGATYPSMAATAGVPYMTPEQVAGSVGGNIGANPFGIAPYVPGGAMTGSPFVSPNTDFGAVPSYVSQPPGGGGGGDPTGGGGANKLLDALRGVKAPAPPEVQRVATPPPPRLAPIQGGEFFAMLSSLGIGPQEFLKMRGGR